MSHARMMSKTEPHCNCVGVLADAPRTASGVRAWCRGRELGTSARAERRPGSQGSGTKMMARRERRRNKAQRLTAGRTIVRFQEVRAQPAAFGVAKRIHALDGRTGHRRHEQLSPGPRAHEDMSSPGGPQKAVRAEPRMRHCGAAGKCSQRKRTTRCRGNVAKLWKSSDR